MGARHSGPTRSVVIDNETPVDVIDVSDEVVQRLKNGLRKGERPVNTSASGQRNVEPPATQSPSPAPPPPTPTTTTTTPLQPPQPASSVPSSYANVRRPPPEVFYAEPGLTTFENRKRNEMSLRKNDAEWMQRMEKMQQNWEKTSGEREQEYNTAINNVKEMFQTTMPQHKIAPCQELKQKLIDCYKQHPNQSLLCDAEVQAFANCVSTSRATIIEEAASTAK